MERAMNTGQTETEVSDYEFQPATRDTTDTTTLSDWLIIQAGRAQLSINPTEFGTTLTNPEEVLIYIYSNAITGLATSLAAVSSVMLLSSF